MNAEQYKLVSSVRKAIILLCVIVGVSGRIEASRGAPGILEFLRERTRTLRELMAAA
jgi:hypothetical protein